MPAIVQYICDYVFFQSLLRYSWSHQRSLMMKMAWTDFFKGKSVYKEWFCFLKYLGLFNNAFCGASLQCDVCFLSLTSPASMTCIPI